MDAQVLCGIQSIHSVNRTPMTHLEGRDALVYELGQLMFNLTRIFKDFDHEYYSTNYCAG